MGILGRAVPSPRRYAERLRISFGPTRHQGPVAPLPGRKSSSVGEPGKEPKTAGPSNTWCEGRLPFRIYVARRRGRAEGVPRSRQEDHPSWTTWTASTRGGRCASHRAYFGKPWSRSPGERPGLRPEAAALLPGRSPSASPPAETDTPGGTMSGVPLRGGAGRAGGGEAAGELLAPKTPAPDRSFSKGKKEPKASPSSRRRAPPTAGCCPTSSTRSGEKWIERGRCSFRFLPGRSWSCSSRISPWVKFQGGEAALVDFRGGLPPRIRDAIQANWKYIRVVSLEAPAGGRDDRPDPARFRYHRSRRGSRARW